MAQDTNEITCNALEPTSDYFKVLVTGFGPFGAHPVNASWEAVSCLPKTIPNTNIDIFKEQVEVCYKYVDTRVPQLWKKYKPDLVIHVGVSDATRKITLESCGHRDDYKGLDNYKYAPCDSKCKAAEKFENSKDVQILKTSLDLDDLVTQFEANKSLLNKTLNIDISKVDLQLSCNAGRYLCEYIYYTSLCQDNTRSLFIHVPPIDKPYSLQELTQSLICIIFLLCQQLISKTEAVECSS